MLETRKWDSPGDDCIVCIHGVAQKGSVFAEMAEALVANGRSVLAVDLRGHGGSGRRPPWNVATHVGDVLETLEAEGIERATWVGHSFGGLVAATLAAEAVERTERLVLLDPGLEVPTERALRSAEIERLDWSFATVDGAVNAVLSNEAIVASPREVVAAYVKDDVQKGPDGRFRFRFCPSTVVVAWSEMTLPPPPIAQVPTLVAIAEKPLFDSSRQQRRYEDELGGLLTKVVVPNGHNVLWESPQETIGAVQRFLEPVGEPAGG
ncbi:MAG TPA: alpha/beta hydrolase [Solirubrobacterales bacterium]|nr:alpha/beta hydrolase [Solirubrobacterales bacterium]